MLLAQRIDWEGWNTEFGTFYEDAVAGQAPKAARLMAVLLYLKHTDSLSDEALVERWVETPYWEAFCRSWLNPLLGQSPEPLRHAA